MDEVRVHLRWLIRRDMPEVLAIERAAFELPRSEDEFIRALRERNCIGMVAEHREQIVGYWLYELHKTRIYLLNFAVAPELQRRGVGRQMLAKLVGKLSAERRSRLTLAVRESNLVAQLFFRAGGFRAVEVLRGYFDQVGEDAYLLEYSVADPRGDDGGAGPVENRIKRYFAADGGAQ